MVIRGQVLGYYANQAEISKATQRYRELKELFMRQKDTELLEMLDDVVRACRRYVEAVIRMEYKAAEIKKRYGAEPGPWKLEIEPLDQNRRIAHDALIAHLEAFNRNAAKKYGWQPEGRIPTGGIFALDPDLLSDPSSKQSRGEIANWAFYLSIGLGAE